MESYDRPCLISLSLRNSIAQQLRNEVDLHHWDPELVILHFAYLVPEECFFSVADLHAVFDQLKLDDWNIETIVMSLRGGTLGYKIKTTHTLKWSRNSRQVNKVDLDFISGKIIFRKRRRIHDGRQAEEFFGGFQGEGGLGGDSRRLDDGGDRLAA